MAPLKIRNDFVTSSDNLKFEESLQTKYTQTITEFTYWKHIHHIMTHKKTDFELYLLFITYNLKLLILLLSV